MQASPFRTAKIIALAGLSAAFLPNVTRADAAEPYPKMAPLAQYLMPSDDEIALARTAAPESISRDAEIMVLSPQGYKTAVPGTNGFVCLVERAWSSPSNDPGFWNPKSRSPLCFNAAGARYCVPLLNRRTGLVLAGLPKAEIVAKMKAARDANEFPPLEAGAMCYMMSKRGRLNDAAGHWHPHLMFYRPLEEASGWGADLPGSPIYENTDDLDHVAVFLVPVMRWSDGSEESKPELCGPTPTPATPATTESH